MNDFAIGLLIAVVALAVLWFLVFPLVEFALEELDLYLHRRK